MDENYNENFEIFFKQEIYDILKERKIINCKYDEMSDELLKAVKDIYDYSYAYFESYFE